MRGAARAGGDPVAPRGHKKRKLDSGEEVKLCRALEQNSTATNRQLSAVVRGKKTCGSHGERLVSSRGSALHNEGYGRERFWLEDVKKIRLDKRIYEDETPSLRSSETRASTEGNTHPSSAISLRHKVHVACIRKAEWCAALGPFGQKRRHERD